NVTGVQTCALPILLMIEPFFVPESVRMREYTDYVQAGNTIILFKNNPDGMFDVSTNPVMVQEDEARIITDQQGEEYKAIVPSPMRIEEEKGDEILLEDETGVLALRSEEHTSELQSRFDLVCRLLLEKK